MHQDDRQRGLRAFSLTHRQQGVFARDTVGTCEYEEETMQHVSLKRFARFYAATHAERVAMMATTGGYDYYASLRKHIRVHHWQTDDIDLLAGSLEALNTVPHLSATQRHTYGELIRQYVAKWRTEDAGYFSVPFARVPFGELSVRVDPEVGIRYRVDQGAFPRVVKLWFNETPSSDNMQAAFYYLLGEALRDRGWEPVWRPGIWDVRRQQFLDLEPSPQDMEDWMQAAAVEYMELYRRFRPSRQEP